MPEESQLPDTTPLPEPWTIKASSTPGDTVSALVYRGLARSIVVTEANERPQQAAAGAKWSAGPLQETTIWRLDVGAPQHLLSQQEQIICERPVLLAPAPSG